MSFNDILDNLRSNDSARLFLWDGLRATGIVLDGEALSDEQMDDFVSALRDNVHVQKFALISASSTRDRADLVLRIFETAIPDHRHIKQLTVSCKTGTIFMDSHMRAIGAALRTNTALTKLDLASFNFLPAVENLVEGLKHNQTLEFLRVDLINLDGIRAIASYLADERCCLKKLECTLTNARAQILAEEGLSKNNTLEELDAAGSEQITDEGCQFIATALQHTNYTLERVVTRGCTQVSVSLRQRIDYLCQTNSRLKEEFRLFNNLGLAARILPGLWPRTILHFQSKPDYVYALLQLKPDICREQPNIRRRRVRDE